MSNRDVQKIGTKNEEKVEKYYRNKDYQVLNLNDRGCPDLLILRDGQIQFFVEAKGGRHKVHSWQVAYQKKLERMGFKTVNIRITDDGNIVKEE